MTETNWKWVIGILVAIAAIILPLLFGKKKISQSQEQNIEGKGSQKQSQKMEE